MITQSAPVVLDEASSTTRPRVRRPGSRHRTWGGAVVGTAVLFALWAFVSSRHPELVVPSPTQTWAAMVSLHDDGTLFSELARTAWRSLVGVSMALAIGTVWGALNGCFRWCLAVTQPALAALMALPPVVLVALGMVWFGPGETVTRLVVMLVALPLIVVSVQEAVRAVDADLIEMAHSFSLSRWSTARHVIAPSIASPVLAATSVTFGQALRVAVMAELLSATDGIGANVATARTNLETADLFAWAAVLVIAVIAAELIVLRPLAAYLLRWRSTPRRETT